MGNTTGALPSSLPAQRMMDYPGNERSGRTPSSDIVEDEFNAGSVEKRGQKSRAEIF
jgi:hypothetical protein